MYVILRNDATKNLKFLPPIMLQFRMILPGNKNYRLIKR
jgi:hypothetical protein